MQFPSASGQKGGIHSQEQVTWLNMPLVQPAVGKSHRNSLFPDDWRADVAVLFSDVIAAATVDTAAAKTSTDWRCMCSKVKEMSSSFSGRDADLDRGDRE
jgi:hypothetical protein